MKRFTVIFPLLLLLCFAPEARSANYYWGGGLGFSRLDFDGFKLEFKNVPAYRRQTVDLKHNAGSTAFGASFIYGLDFGWAGSLPLRLELESAVSGGASSSKRDYYRTPQGMLVGAEVVMRLDVNWFWSAGLNLWLDVPVGGFPLKPYLGGGLGYQVISYDADIAVNPDISAFGAAAGVTGRSFAHYHKLGGGARMAVGKRTFLDLGLSYAKKQNWSISAAPLDLNFSSRVLDARLGLRYYF